MRDSAIVSLVTGTLPIAFCDPKFRMVSFALALNEVGQIHAIDKTVDMEQALPSATSLQEVIVEITARQRE